MLKPAFTREQWPRIAELFDEALAVGPAGQQAWLAHLHRTEPGLAPHVQQLPAAHASQETADWLERGPVLDTPAPQVSRHAPGDVLGRYRLQAHVATGGMGEVWQATALEGPAERQVALKLPLLARESSAARFAREAAILARLAHPHIARLLDAGSAATAAGVTPYIALEWIEGAPLLAWCASRGLGTRARIELFLQVLDAVGYAHAHLVLHRDLKPSNVLVSAPGEVKLLDFGIAKLLGDEARADATELTQAAGRVMTTAYAAPEQLRGQTLTPATDVYALGVLLFELLTGERPYRTALQTPAQLEQAIVAGDLRRPGQLRRDLRGDIDAIIGRAMQLDPAARYPGAQALAEDLRRHLQGQPVQARPDTLLYVATRLVHRHRVAAFGALATLAALLAGGVLAGLQAQRAEQARQGAVAAGLRAQATQRFMLDLLDDAAKAGKPLTVAELMSRAEALGRGTLAGKPDQLAAVLGIVGSDESASRDPAHGAALLQEAATLARDPALRATLACSASLAGAAAGSPDAAKARMREHIADTTLDAGTRSTCRLSLAQLLIQNGEPAEAAALVQAAYRHFEPLGAEAWRELARAVAMQTYLGASGGGAGTDLRVQGLLSLLQTLGRERNNVALGLWNTWGTLAMVSGEPAAAITRYGQVVRLTEQDYGAEGNSPYNLNMLATAHTAFGTLDEAAGLFERSAARAGRDGTGAMQFTAACLRARVAALQGQPAQAEAWFVRAAAVPDLGEPLRRNARPFCDLARAEAAVLGGRAAEAAGLLAPLLAAGLPPSIRLAAQLVQAEAQLALLQSQQALQTATEAVATARALQADNTHSARTGQALMLQALAEARLGRTRDAVRHHAEAATHLRATVHASQRWRARADAAVR